MKSNCLLSIRRLHTWVRLGCSAEERSVPQEVEVDLEISFPAVPDGVRTDRLEDTICYGDVCADITEASRAGEFALIEKLAGDVMKRIRDRVGRGYGLKLSIHKLRPPIDNLRGGVVFILEDGT